jgi:hypothetical protein
MEKYYVPGIEDIKIGYECEVVSNYWEEEVSFEDWKPWVVSAQDIKYADRKGVTAIGLLFPPFPDRNPPRIRTPYLTKEQIEKEGWEFRKTNKVRWWYEKPFEVCFGGIPMSPAHKYWEIQLVHDPEYAAIKISAKISDDTLSDIFEGKCPSINELRQIQKLLQIK